jgi:hypothetical protein
VAIHNLLDAKREFAALISANFALGVPGGVSSDQHRRDLVFRWVDGN